MKGDYEGSLTPDTIVPLIGIRAWKAKHNGQHQLRLSSVYKETLWPINRKKMASCIEPFPNWVQSPDGIWLLNQTAIHDPHDAPDEDCSCGIYAVNSTDYSDNLTAWPDSTYIGLVFIWGKVLEGQKGFRGQFARPAALFKEDKKKAMIQRLAKIYRIPVVDDLDVALQSQKAAQTNNRQK